MKLAKRIKLYHDLLFILLATILILIFYGRVFFFYNGYISFQNFVPNSAVYPTSFYFYSPYYAGGSPILEPLPNIITGIVTDFFRVFIGSLIGYTLSIKLYIYSIVLFYFASFYVLTGSFTNKFVPRILSSIFFLLNPISFVMLSFGDYPNFMGFSFYFIGLSFLIKSINENISDRYLLISLMFLLLSVVEEQIFYLGILLYLIIGIYFVIMKQKNIIFKESIKFTSKYFFFLITTSLAFILPFIFASFLSVTPTGPVSKGFNVFINASLSPSTLLFLQGTGNLAPYSVSLLGHYYYVLWFLLLYAIVVFVMIVASKIKRRS